MRPKGHSAAATLSPARGRGHPECRARSGKDKKDSRRAEPPKGPGAWWAASGKGTRAEARGRGKGAACSTEAPPIEGPMRSVTSHGAPRDVGGEGEEELSRERGLSGGGPRGGRGAIGNCSLLAGVRGERTLGPSSGARP